MGHRRAPLWAQAVQLVLVRGHGLFQEYMNPSLHALGGHPGLQEEEGGHHRQVRFLPVQHDVVVLIEGDKRGFHLVNEEGPGILVSRPRRDADECELGQPVPHAQRQVDVAARADDHSLHGAPPFGHPGL
jgi:hypothetical protein